MVRKRYPEVRDTISEISRDTQAPSIRAVVECQVRFQLAGFAAPSWDELPKEHSPRHEPDEEELRIGPRLGWQQPASKVLEEKLLRELWPPLVGVRNHRAMLRSKQDFPHVNQRRESRRSSAVLATPSFLPLTHKAPSPMRTFPQVA